MGSKEDALLLGEDFPGAKAYTKKADIKLRSSVLANVVLVIVCTTLLTVSFSRTGQFSSIDELYSPANIAIEYEYRQWTNSTEFLGFPDAQWDHYMSNLMAGTLIRISEDELDLAASTSIPLKDGGFAAGLGVAHNIHCVKRLKKLIYHQYFYPDLEQDRAQYNELRYHADHCLDFILQDLMCHIDYSLFTLAWEIEPDGNKLLSHRLPIQRKCVKWNNLQHWMQSRSVNSDLLVKS